MGVDVKKFLDASPNKKILKKSYRVPCEVHNMADLLIRKVRTREDKNGNLNEKGFVSWYRDILDVD